MSRKKFGTPEIIDKHQKCLPDCPDRTSECHATCERYKEDRARQDILNTIVSARKRPDKDYYDYMCKTAKRGK